MCKKHLNDRNEKRKTREMTLVFKNIPIWKRRCKNDGISNRRYRKNQKTTSMWKQTVGTCKSGCRL